MLGNLSDAGTARIAKNCHAKEASSSGLASQVDMLAYINARVWQAVIDRMFERSIQLGLLRNAVGGMQLTLHRKAA